MRRNGEPHLILSLPDRSTSLIPAAWTDGGTLRAPVPGAKPTSLVFGFLADLMRARTVVDALLRRLDSLEPCPAGEESPHAAEAIRQMSGVAEQTPAVETPGAGRTRIRDRNSHASDGQGDQAGREEGQR